MSPWQIATKEQLQRLKDDSITGWDDSFVITANIDMQTGQYPCMWSSSIGNSDASKFTGKIDGGGHVISGLNIGPIGSTSPMYAGLVGYLGAGGVITKLGFTGSVTASSTNGLANVFAGGLVARTLTGASVSYSYATGNVTTTLVTGSPSAWAGGLVGNINGGSVSNSYATGNVQVLSSGGFLNAGGLVGFVAGNASASVEKSYSTGSVTALGGNSAAVGGFAGTRGGNDLASGNFFDTMSSGTGTAVGGGSSAGIAGKSTVLMKTFSTYDDSGWAITNGWNTFLAPTRIWGICAGTTRAFLLWQYTSTPCPWTPGAPTITGITPGGTSASVAFTVDDTGNAALTRLEFAYDDTNTVDDSTATVTSPATAGRLAQGTTYTLYMRVVNTQFTGPWSLPQTFTTLRKPGAPTITTVTPALSSAQVTFTADDSGGSAITRLEFALDDTITVDDSTTNLASPYTVSNLASRTTYTLYMRAINAQGTGPWSTPTIFTTLTPPPPPPPTPATAPTGVVATAGDAALVATWQSPTSTGSYPITNYKATVLPGGQMCLSVTTTCEITGLTNGVTYRVVVRALTGAGWSEQSTPSNAVTPRPSVTPSLTITGSRGSGAERKVITVRGMSTGLVGDSVTMWRALDGGTPVPSTNTITIRDDGTFEWSRSTSREITLYAEAAGTRSNYIRIKAR